MGLMPESEKKKGRIGGSYGSSSRRKTMSEVTKIFCRFAIEEKKKGRIGAAIPLVPCTKCNFKIDLENFGPPLKTLVIPPY